MTPFEVAELLERLAGRVISIRGVSRRNPHAFAEDKSELAGEMRAEARRLRAPDRFEPDVQAIQPGTRLIKGRAIPVEVRRKAS